MIKVPIQVKVSSSGPHKGPYTCVFNSTNSCATFEQNNLTIFANFSNEYIASTVVVYTDPSCISSTIITATFVDSLGCTVTDTIPVNNPCNLTNSISSSSEFQFVATTTGGSGSYTYQWIFDTNVWQTIDNNLSDGLLILELKSLNVPNATTIQCVAKDTVHNCTKTASMSYLFCKPSAMPTEVRLSCNTDSLTGCSLTAIASQYVNYNLFESVRPCSGQVIDWSFLETNSVPGVCLINNGDGTISVATNKTAAQTVSLQYRVRTTNGITSNFGTLTLVIPACNPAEKGFAGVPMTIQLTAEDDVSDVRTLPVEQRVSGTPDWATFQFLNTPSWGTVTFNANREIKYTITDNTTTTSVPDVIKWSLQSTQGMQINITDTVLRDAIAIPVTTTETICNSCGETTGPIDVLANDTGDIDRSTLTITLNDPDIVITKDSDNNLTFTSLPGASFANLNRYKVANTQGAYSLEQGFFVQTACVGTNNAPTLTLTCVPVKTFNIKNYFTNPNSFGDLFEEVTQDSPTYASQGGVITNGVVNLTGLVNKTYLFKYTAQNVTACSPAHDDTGILTVVHGATPNIVFTAAVNNGNGTSSYTILFSGVVSNFLVTLNGLTPSFQSNINIVDNRFATFTLYNVSGLNTVNIQATSVCGNTISATDASITI